MDFMFGIFPVFFIAVFLLVIGTFIAMFVKGISRWSKNNRSPVLTVRAVVVAKRDQYHRHRHHTGGTGMHHTHYSTTYYVTFQVDSGDRMELQLDGDEYGLLVEGDEGSLTFQGTRFLNFQRNPL